MCDVSPRHSGNDTAGYTDPSKDRRDFHQHAVAESLINCRSLDVCPTTSHTPFR